MPVLKSPADYTHRLPNAQFRALATPSRGARETSVWRVSVAPGTHGQPHTLTREEVFVVLSGSAHVRLAGERALAVEGDAIVVPADVEFELSAAGDTPVELLCCMPVGGQAQLGGGAPFTPPWAL